MSKALAKAFELGKNAAFVEEGKVFECCYCRETKTNDQMDESLANICHKCADGFQHKEGAASPLADEESHEEKDE